MFFLSVHKKMVFCPLLIHTMSGRLLCQIMQLSLGNIQGLRKQINIYKGEGREHPSPLHTYFSPSVPSHINLLEKKKQSSRGMVMQGAWTVLLLMMWVLPYSTLHQQWKKADSRGHPSRPVVLNRSNFTTEGTFVNV